MLMRLIVSSHFSIQHDCYFKSNIYHIFRSIRVQEGITFLGRQAVFIRTHVMYSPDSCMEREILHEQRFATEEDRR
jgi:hypothetical protein